MPLESSPVVRVYQLSSVNIATFASLPDSIFEINVLILVQWFALMDRRSQSTVLMRPVADLLLSRNGLQPSEALPIKWPYFCLTFFVKSASSACQQFTDWWKAGIFQRLDIVPVHCILRNLAFVLVVPLFFASVEARVGEMESGPACGPVASLDCRIPRRHRRRLRRPAPNSAPLRFPQGCLHRHRRRVGPEAEGFSGRMLECPGV